MTKYNAIEFWNRYSLKNEKSWNGAEHYAEIDNAISLIAKYLKPDASVLDVGCAWGRFFLRCRDKGLRLNIEMCDISQEFIGQCIRATGQTPSWWDGRTLSYEDSSFDLVYSQSVLLHVRPYMLGRVWREQVRVSRKYIFIATSIPELTFEREQEDKKEGVFCFAHDYRKLIERTNLRIVDEKLFSDGLRVNWLLSKK